MSTTVQDEPTATPAATRAPRWLPLLVGLMFGLAGSGSSAAAVAVPALRTDLGLGDGTAAWVLSAYALTLAVTTAVYGRVADLVGVRMPLIVGVLLMAAGAVVAAAAPTFAVLLVGRLLQGAGAGAVPVLAVALLTARYTGPARAVALGAATGTAAALTSLGPLIGGALETSIGWPAAVALPALALLLLPAVAAAAPPRGTGGSLDVLGAVLVTAVATGLVLLVQSPSSGPIVGAVGAGLLLAGVPLVIRHVRRRPAGFLPHAVATNRAVLGAAGAAATVPAAWFALLVAIPLWLGGRGWTGLGIGLLLVPSAVAGFVAARLAGRLLIRLGGSRTLTIAAALSALGVLSAALGVAIGAPAVLAVAVVVLSVAFGFGQPAMISIVGERSAADVRGVAIGVATLVFLVGAGVGSAAMGGLGPIIGTAPTLAVLAVLPLVAVPLVRILTRS